MSQHRKSDYTSKGSNSNRLFAEDRLAHNWYRFVLSFPAHLVRNYLQKFRLDQDAIVLDPFCGTGTTLVECKKLGIPSIGLEAHPFAHFASDVKTDWTPDPEALKEHAEKIAVLARKKLNSQGIEDTPPLPLFSKPEGTFGKRITELRGLPREKAKLLLSESISPLPLHKVLVLLECLEQNHDSRYCNHELLALGKALVCSISNLKFGPEVGVGKPKPDSPVVLPWLDAVETIAKDLQSLQKLNNTAAKAYKADARSASQVLSDVKIDAVITSPPYPNEKDYSRTMRLESVILGFINNSNELRKLKKGLIRSNTRGVYKKDDDDKWIAGNKEVEQIAERIEARRIELGKTSGFERQYHKVTKLYFGGMARHLAELRTVLRPGARMAYVVGDQASYLRVMIRTGQLLADIAECLGYKVKNIDLFRTRLATATGEKLREEVLLLQWPGGEITPKEKGAYLVKN